MSGIQQMLLASGKPKVQMAFQAAGAGENSSALGAIGPAYPAGITYGDILLAHVVAIDGSVGGVVTPSGWTSLDYRTIGSTFASRLMYRIASGLESGAQSFVVADSVNAWGRIYRFNRGLGVESGTGQANSGSSATMPVSNVTGTKPLSVAVQAFFAQVNTTIGNISGESGGDYTEAVAEYAVGGGAAAIMSLQVATLVAAGSITGGSATLGAAGTNRITHAGVLFP